MADIIVGSSTEAVVVDNDTTSVVVSPNTELVSQESTKIEAVVTQVDNTTTVVAGQPGPQGVAGDSINYINILAGQDLSGHRVVSSNSTGYVIYADKDIPDTGNKVLGITTGAVINGNIAEVQLVGVLEEPSWNWNSTDPIFIGNNGQLTQIAPSTGYLYIVGFPMSTTKIFIDKQPPIVLG
jgi:hypothetical protein